MRRDGLTVKNISLTPRGPQFQNGFTFSGNFGTSGTPWAEWPRVLPLYSGKAVWNNSPPNIIGGTRRSVRAGPSNTGFHMCRGGHGQYRRHVLKAMATCSTGMSSGSV